MAPASRFTFAFYILALPHVFLSAVALSLDYCSSTNTGAGFEFIFSTYQSNGACRDTCSKGYAVAILQGKSCWCSNDVPGGTTSIDDCNESCPGYPSDKCGNSSKDLFAYILLEKPSKTVGQTSQTLQSHSTKSTFGPEPSTKLDTYSSLLTITQATSQSAITVTVANSQSGVISSSSRTTSSASTSGANKPIQTVLGPVVTQTISPDASQTAVPTKDSSLSGGAIAGIVTGTLLAVGLIISMVLWVFCIRRRQEKNMNDDMDPFERSVPSPSFQTTLQTPAMAYNQRGSKPMNGGVGSNDRNLLSVPAFTDSRMTNDVAIYPNGNRQSNISLQDNQDYSRPVLRLTNPD
ncbi:hypothetical protein PAAG_04123 [Paracoccidioides lutzii Pb01]|uniref:WSC domain-containing protein n=1 Tax=Paracoccidioides lutzii (strain ATCC MYA-826 / Pb01) TaxID=502779 RepID=C1H029_PARBA|nr:hypothetical protein PAAG_04123 [Paracoccidioides lutzii Pb01]EEH33070.2 hypothetical protein PAAG_04123 [Paracoccidioides lutzii Pb01]